jgi:hypothetical protein
VEWDNEVEKKAIRLMDKKAKGRVLEKKSEILLVIKSWKSI